ncbi:hypothetical protein LC048_21135 [Mesobacillus subterraneus]|uniref:hypothetical protein n=1 Tax=Mesobacillus subterraneus TaxID=285983 RepID=UPI001CFDA96D|nr:hypothetical protein [Mesobacillus subterraneus]WLR54870.1 hypothetical protein LC048_21135 [Mesobacillus subterraneus]
MKERKSLIRSLRFAYVVTEQADKEKLTDQELLTAIKIIKSLHEEKATAATAAISVSIEHDGRELAEYLVKDLNSLQKIDEPKESNQLVGFREFIASKPFQDKCEEILEKQSDNFLKQLICLYQQDEENPTGGPI